MSHGNAVYFFDCPNIVTIILCGGLAEGKVKSLLQHIMKALLTFSDGFLDVTWELDLLGLATITLQKSFHCKTWYSLDR